MSESTSSGDRSRYTVVRDVLIFQAKLWLEGFKDVALMPLSLGAAMIDVLLPQRVGRGALYAVMKLGDRFERWVHLYAALGERQANEAQSSIPVDSLDDLLNDAADGLEKRASSGHSETTDASGANSGP